MVSGKKMELHDNIWLPGCDRWLLPAVQQCRCFLAQNAVDRKMILVGNLR